VPPRWSAEPWTYLRGMIYKGPSLYEGIIAVVHAGTAEEAEANGCLMRSAPEAARLLAAAYPHAPLPLREQIHTWFSSVGVTLEDFGDSGPPHRNK